MINTDLGLSQSGSLAIEPTAMGGFGIEVTRRGAVEVVRLRAARSTADLVPAWGGNCIAFVDDGVTILDPAPIDEIARKPAAWGVPILFPFPNRIRDGRFTFEGREFRVDPPRHGLVRDKPMRIVAHGAGATTGAWLTMRLDATDHPATILSAYPFPFRLDVTVRLHPRVLELTAIACNTGDRTMPVGFGVHPYFAAAEGGELCVPADRRWVLVDNLPTGDLVAVDGRYDLRRAKPIGGLELDDVYTSLRPDADGRVRYAIEDPRAGRRTVIECDPRVLPEVVVYTPPAPRRAICVEPQSCPTDAFNLAARGVDSHMLRLAPGGEARWTIVVRAK